MIAQGQISTPKTGLELTGLVARRNELRDQIETANEQRAELAEQIQRIGPSEAAVRAGPIARLQQVDARIDRLSRELQASDDAIAEAKSKGIGTDEQGSGVHIYTPGPATAPPALPDFPRIYFGESGTAQPATWQDRALDSLKFNGPITLASVVLVGALIYWRLSRAMKSRLDRLQSTQNGALLQLQQSLDSVAVEIERVSENQRFVTKLVGEKQPAERR